MAVHGNWRCYDGLFRKRPYLVPMALVKLGVIVSAITGKVGGNIFSRNKGGAYVKAWVNPTNPQTVIQQAWRSGFSSRSTDWRGLTESERNGWKASALLRPVTNRLGEQRFLSGYGLFMKQNMALATASTGLLAIAPVPIPIPAYTLDATAWDIGATGSLTIVMTRADGTPPLNTISEYIVISLSIPTTVGVSPVLARQLVAVNSASSMTTVSDQQLIIAVPYATVLGIIPVPVSGQQLLAGVSPLNVTDPWPVVKLTELINLVF